MSENPPGFAALKSLHPDSQLLKEGGNPFVLLPAFSFQSAGRDMQMDLLLCPQQHSGYVTRLFFQNRIDGRGQNWNPHRVVDREWWSPSWNDVSPCLPWPAMLCAHLRGVA